MANPNPTAPLINQVVVVNVPLTNIKGTEYSYTFPARSKHIKFGLRPDLVNNPDLYWYMTSVGNVDVTGQSTVPYNTVGHADLPRHEYWNGALFNAQTMYFQVSHATEVLEISYILDL